MGLDGPTTAASQPSPLLSKRTSDPLVCAFEQRLKQLKRHKMLGPFQDSEVVLAQRWLLMAEHVQTCDSTAAGTCSLGERCIPGKRLLAHANSCQAAGEACWHPGCTAFLRRVLNHYKDCQDPECHVCMPVRKYVKQQEQLGSAAREVAKQGLQQQPKQQVQPAPIFAAREGVHCPGPNLCFGSPPQPPAAAGGDLSASLMETPATAVASTSAPLPGAPQSNGPTTPVTPPQGLKDELSSPLQAWGSTLLALTPPTPPLAMPLPNVGIPAVTPVHPGMAVTQPPGSMPLPVPPPQQQSHGPHKHTGAVRPAMPLMYPAPLHPIPSMYPYPVPIPHPSHHPYPCWPHMPLGSPVSAPGWLAYPTHAPAHPAAQAHMHVMGARAAAVPPGTSPPYMAMQPWPMPPPPAYAVPYAAPVAMPHQQPVLHAPVPAPAPTPTTTPATMSTTTAAMQQPTPTIAAPTLNPQQQQQQQHQESRPRPADALAPVVLQQQPSLSAVATHQQPQLDGSLFDEVDNRWQAQGPVMLAAAAATTTVM